LSASPAQERRQLVASDQSVVSTQGLLDRKKLPLFQVAKVGRIGTSAGCATMFAPRTVRLTEALSKCMLPFIVESCFLKIESGLTLDVFCGGRIALRLYEGPLHLGVLNNLQSRLIEPRANHIPVTPNIANSEHFLQYLRLRRRFWASREEHQG